MPYIDPEKRSEYHASYSKKWRDAKRAADPEFDTKNNRRQRAANPKAYMHARAKNRAKMGNIIFTLKREDFEIPEYCPVFPHIKLEFSDGRTRPDNIPTLDRIIPALGYVKGNVRVISMRANRLKSDATAEELEAIVRYIRCPVR